MLFSAQTCKIHTHNTYTNLIIVINSFIIINSYNLPWSFNNTYLCEPSIKRLFPQKHIQLDMRLGVDWPHAIMFPGDLKTSLERPSNYNHDQYLPQYFIVLPMPLPGTDPLVSLWLGITDVCKRQISAWDIWGWHHENTSSYYNQGAYWDTAIRTEH